jgi:hypothetical protein
MIPLEPPRRAGPLRVTSVVLSAASVSVRWIWPDPPSADLKSLLASSRDLFSSMSIADDTGTEYRRKGSGGGGSVDFIGHSDFVPELRRTATELRFGIAGHSVSIPVQTVA